MNLFIRVILYILLLFIFLPSCSQKPTLEGFNSELWKKDKMACEGKRSYLAEILFSKRTELMGMDYSELTELLGRPEKTDAEDRGKKSYSWFIEPGSQCGPRLILEGAKIVFEMDALGSVNLVVEKRF